MITPKKMPSRRRSALALLLPAALIGALAACGAPEGSNPPTSTSPAPAAPTTAADPGPVPSAGLHLIDRDGRRLAFHVTPGTSPTIVLDAGGGEDSSSWDSLVPRLSRATGSRVITYDRAGMGASDEVPGAWDPQAAAGDLQAGLRELGVTRDVVLVSHSQAGEVTTYFTRANPGVLAGSVLVDANVPPFFTDDEVRRLVALTTPQIEELEKQPSTKANRQLIATADGFGPTHQAYHRVAWPDDVPVTYVVSEKTPFDGSPQDARRWRDAAAAFVGDGPRRTLVTARGSSHDIPRDAPAVVLEEVEKMTAAAR
ncbi:alpha/beta hydrolase [Microlunatus spumicola]|uniref:Alpha/beta hydrolase n=1 Tax=Microlunatus spumicola TaxID=81499 RepID=A0ABP6WM75_9ACTN